MLLLGGLLVGHHEDAAVTFERRGDGQAVTGVAGCRLDDRAAGLEEAGPLGCLDHRQADPILDRTARVQHLQLGQQERLTVGRAKVPREPADPDERRAPDQIQNGLRVLHRGEDTVSDGLGPRLVAVRPHGWLIAVWVSGLVDV